MGWFKRIFVETSHGEITDITALDKEHYESFLDTVRKIEIAYLAAKKLKNINENDKIQSKR
jgi:hypothetical protein